MAVNLDVNQLAGQLKEAFAPLADKLGKSAEAVYAMAVKDAVITGQNLEFGVYAFGMGLILSLIAFFVGIGKDEEALSVLGLFGSGICLLVLVLMFPDMNHYLGNPEYMALKDLLRSIKN